MIRLKWVGGQRDVTGCGDCPMCGYGDGRLGGWCQADDGWRAVAKEKGYPDWCPLLTLEVERGD